MKRVIISLLAVSALAAPAYAASGAVSCSTAPKSKWQPQAKLEQILKSKGFTVRTIKVENGCYEVYAMDSHGKRANMAFNAETLKQLNNAEAGEG